MSNNTLQHLEWRLRQISNKANIHPGQCVLLSFRIFKSQNEVLGWTKPEATAIEPKLFNYSCVNFIYRSRDWADIMANIPNGDTLILMQSGEPLGILADKI